MLRKIMWLVYYLLSLWFIKKAKNIREVVEMGFLIAIFLLVMLVANI